MESQDVLIVGAGVMGLNTAYELAKNKIKVSLVDQFLPYRKASWAGAGIIPPGNPNLAANPADWLRAKSSSIFPVLSAELHEYTNINNCYTKCGGLELTSNYEETNELGWTQENIKFERVNTSDLKSSNPYLNPKDFKATYFPEMAQIRNPRHLKALIEACKLLGVRIYNDCKITGILKKGSQVLGLESETGIFSADQFIITAGPWSGEFLSQEKIDTKIFPVRGQILLLQSSLPLKEIILKDKHYIVPRGEGLVLVGSTEEDVGFNGATTSQGKEHLFKTACDLIPQLQHSKIMDHWSGLRPCSSKNLPLIGKSPSSDNLYFATGHFRQGLQTSPASALLIKSIIMKEDLGIDCEYFMKTNEQTQPYNPLFQS
jgi:glycine oxidase